jgi:FtsP/CotA-like multicopper oxidase with cupredoxin domain
VNRRELVKLGLLSGAALASKAFAKGRGSGSGGSGSGRGSGSGSSSISSTSTSGGSVSTLSGSSGGSGGSGSTSGDAITPGGNKVPKDLIASPPTRPWLVELPRIPVAQPLANGMSGLSGPAWDDTLDLAPGDCIKRPHQRYKQFRPVKIYELAERQNNFFSWHPDLPKQPIWGFNGMFPGPTFISRYHEPLQVRVHNQLPRTSNLGFGLPSTTTHLHNFHTASESDGFPGDFLTPGEFHDHHYAMECPGFTTPEGDDPREVLNTLWYHDHMLDFTAQNTYAGLVGFHLMFDEFDSGDETDPNPKALRFPSGEYDIPLMFADKAFDRFSGMLYFDLFNFDGMLGDKWTVNGIIQPYLPVQRRKYRFRLLGVGPSRWWQFKLSDNSPMLQIAEDGNLLPFPVLRSSVRLAVAERADVIVDFSKYPAGTKLYLMNILEQDNGRGPSGKLLPVGDQVLRFDVVGDPPAKDQSQPTFANYRTFKMRDLPPIDLRNVAATRTWRFDRSNGGWTVNGKFFNVDEVRAHVKQNTKEVWVIQNNSGSWSHPIHIHFEEFRILSRNRVAPPAWEKGRKDVIKLNPNEEVRILMNFRDWEGRYPMHCHNTVHEDHAMMIRWDLEP